MKQPSDERLERYKGLIEKYHASLDLMSEAGLGSLEDKFADGQVYAEGIGALGFGDARILDLGSGVGLPGVVIASVLPYSSLLLVERRRRRSAFLRLVVAQLGLDNAAVHQADVRGLELAPVSVITAQAVGSFADLYSLTHHLHAPQVSLLSRKGDAWRQEVKQLEERLGVEVEALELASLSSHGRLIAVRLPGGKGCRS